MHFRVTVCRSQFAQMNVGLELGQIAVQLEISFLSDILRQRPILEEIVGKLYTIDSCPFDDGGESLFVRERRVNNSLDTASIDSTKTVLAAAAIP